MNATQVQSSQCFGESIGDSQTADVTAKHNKLDPTSCEVSGQDIVYVL